MQAVIPSRPGVLALVLGAKAAAASGWQAAGRWRGAATNYAYTSYYEDQAHVHFGAAQAGD